MIEKMAYEAPDRIAYRMVPSGFSLTWSELESRTRRCALKMIREGLNPGDGVAVYLENHSRYFEILWAAHRAGLYYTTVSLHLKKVELEYIVQDCGAKIIFVSQQTLQNLSPEWLESLGIRCIVIDGNDGVQNPFIDYAAWLSGTSLDEALPEGLPEGTDFCYSSGTTGRPKGIKRPLQTANSYFHKKEDSRTQWKDFGPESVYLSTAPLYHTAPVRWNLSVMKAGGTCVIMEKFDPLLALETIEQYLVTHGQFVPTMFTRLLRLPENERNRHAIHSMKYMIHAAAPCPVSIKQKMIEWFGPIVYEYYSGTELVGRTSIDTAEWLTHVGSVGLPEFGAVHIVGEGGQEVNARDIGIIYFSGGGRFQYHNDEEKTLAAYNENGWATYGDIGYLDEDGYLYLTDRIANTIVSGGVNIYPQEAENLLSTHPMVRDVAVVGVPDEEFGESVKAVVELIDPDAASAETEQMLIAFCRDQISTIKCPKSVDFVTTLPRTGTGKLLKREVRDKYWTAKGPSRIAH